MSEQRLHPLSWLFLLGATLKEIALPLVALLFFGHKQDSWVLWGGLPLLGAGAWAALRAFSYRYQLGESELLVRDGVLDRTQRHIPFARIHNISQRRKLAHRLLGVTELRLESAAGGKPEAVLKVLGLDAAAALEALLRGAPGQSAAPAESAAAPLLTLPPGEILRLGLVSNRGLLMAGVLLGVVMQNRFLREQLGARMQAPARWLGGLMQSQAATGHWSNLALGALLALAAAFVLLRLLSVLLAFFRYHGFTLERDGERLLARHGLLTLVRSGARLPRLQSWTLEEGFLQRRLGRCRLAVTVAGARHEHGHGTEPGANFSELAPIATPAQAHALLRLCLPALDWDALRWRPLHPATVARRLIGHARWVLPALLAGAALDARYGWPLPPALLLAGCAALAAAMLWHARAWARFAAIAEAGDVLLYRSGVWRRRWHILATPRLQNLSLYSSPLDRRLGIVHLRADTQGGSRSRHALDIPGLERATADALRARLWPALRRPLEAENSSMQSSA